MLSGRRNRAIRWVDWRSPKRLFANPRREELRQYVLAVHTTSKTRRAMVTVFRDGFLIALVGLTLLAIAHTVSWAVPLDDAPTPVDVNIISPSPAP